MLCRACDAPLEVESLSTIRERDPVLACMAVPLFVLHVRGDHTQHTGIENRATGVPRRARRSIPNPSHMPGLSGQCAQQLVGGGILGWVHPKTLLDELSIRLALCVFALGCANGICLDAVGALPARYPVRRAQGF